MYPKSVTMNLLEIKLTERQRESHRRGVSSLDFKENGWLWSLCVYKMKGW